MTNPMSTTPNARDSAQTRSRMSGVFRNLGYEVLPFKGTEENVVKFVPKDMRLTVTASPPRGINATIALVEKLAGYGYTVAPHLSARMIAGDEELAAIVTRLRAAGVTSVFVVGGDAKDAAGEYENALDLLKALQRVGHTFTDIGIGGYPEGHAFISDEQLDAALLEKAPFATYIVTQICFDPKAIVTWAESIKSKGVNLPVRVGMPGAVSRQKLLRISLASGVGDSVAFLKKQQSMFWRFFVPGGYSPNKLIQGLKRGIGDTNNNISDFHIFTFNELEQTDLWRRKMLQRFGA
jgi:methylenetetrahydrofolate reductase (NADPH)